MVSAGKHKTQASLSSQGLILPQGKHIPSKTGGLVPPKGFLWTWTLPALGRPAEVFSVVTLPIALDFSWRTKENEKTSTGIAASTGAPNPGNSSWTLDSSSCTDLHRDVWRSPGPECPCPVTQNQSMLSVLVPVWGNGASMGKWSQQVSRLPVE